MKEKITVRMARRSAWVAPDANFIFFSESVSKLTPKRKNKGGEKETNQQKNASRKSKLLHTNGKED
jgi:hypothetical protein